MPDSPTEIDLGNDMWLMEVDLETLREQDVNAHVMVPRLFERLVENMRRRGRMESLVYCAQPNGEGPIEIVSGHHRRRAALQADIKRAWILCDRAEMTRSQIIAKQLAHNFLVGTDDEDILKTLLSRIDMPDDLLETGAPPELLSSLEHDAMLLFTPRVDFRWKTVSFVFLPHQLDNLNALLDSLYGRQDLVIAALEDQWETFLHTLAAWARIKNIRAGGTAIAKLTELALAEVDKHEAAQIKET